MGENRTFGQIILPRLVISKLLHRQELRGRRSVSEISGVVDETLGKRPLDGHKDTLKYRVFASTWNVGAMAPSDDLDLEDWLDRRVNSYDIYVLGFQEIVPLNIRNVLGPRKTRISTKWNSLIGKALNKRKEKMGQSCTKQLQIAVQWRALRKEDTSDASGGKEGDVLLRNFDAADILARTRFPGGATQELPKKILDHDQVVLLGDLNYRINLEEAETRLLVKARNWSILLQNDQLLSESSTGRHFEGWQEGLITFSPTYKYHPNSDQYYRCFDGAPPGEKKRAPAWCDRILWRGKSLKQIQYETCDYRLSDHRPVRAVFHAECEIRGDADSMGGFMR